MDKFEQRSRELFHDSVDGMDMRTRSQLTQARHVALDAAALTAQRPWIFRLPLWTPAAGLAAALAVATALWLGAPLAQHGATDGQTNLDDLELVAASDGNPGDAIEMLQDDLDFYDWADKTANSGPSA